MFLFHFYQKVISFYMHALGNLHLLNHTVHGCSNHHFHFHSTDHQQRLTFSDLITNLNFDLQYISRHRTTNGAFYTNSCFWMKIHFLHGFIIFNSNRP
uniref:Uncharacterized protein n=1 Tax=Ciona intestinalis TaxID=7719 RepID=H2XUM8_CIOIN